MPTASRSGAIPVRGARKAADEAADSQSAHLTIPVLGRLPVPPPAHLAWYAGVGALAVFGVVDWPVAVLIGVGKALADNRSNETLRQFGEALEQA
jgi:hypothetical protein